MYQLSEITPAYDYDELILDQQANTTMVTLPGPGWIRIGTVDLELDGHAVHGDLVGRVTWDTGYYPPSGDVGHRAYVGAFDGPEAFRLTWTGYSLDTNFPRAFEGSSACCEVVYDGTWIAELEPDTAGELPPDYRTECSTAPGGAAAAALGAWLVVASRRRGRRPVVGRAAPSRRQ